LKSIYTITPSWLIKNRKEFIKGIGALERLGFKILNKKFVTKLSSAREKAGQIHRAFLNKKIDIILAQRGGYSSMKVLPHIDFSIIKKNPKIFAGFSDLSVMLNIIYEKTGLITLHSPMVLNFSPYRKFTADSFLNAVNGFSEKGLFKGAPVKVYRHGVARGILKGGNLITLTALIGTKWEINTDSAVLFLEDVDEKLHKVDRCLMQWIFAGKFRKVRGLILGDFRGVKDIDIYNMLSGQVKIDFPVVHCPYIGHVRNKITLPVGSKVELNTKRQSLTVL
jgi:muramoyltetrapeptide carboxypeptidase